MRQSRLYRRGRDDRRYAWYAWKKNEKGVDEDKGGIKMRERARSQLRQTIQPTRCLRLRQRSLQLGVKHHTELLPPAEILELCCFSLYRNERLMRNPGSYKKDGTYLLWKVHERSNVNMYIYSYVVQERPLLSILVLRISFFCMGKKTIFEMESLYYHFIIRAPTYGLDDLLCTFNFLCVLEISPFRRKGFFFLCRNMIFVAPC